MFELRLAITILGIKAHDRQLFRPILYALMLKVVRIQCGGLGSHLGFGAVVVLHRASLAGLF